MTKEMTFETWLATVDRIFSANFGMSIFDLPDMCYHDMFDDGLTPKQMVREIMAEMPDLMF